MKNIVILIAVVFFSTLVFSQSQIVNESNISNDSTFRADLTNSKFTLYFNHEKISIKIKMGEIKIKYHENGNERKHLSLKIKEGDQLQLSFFGNDYIFSILEFTEDEFLAVLKCKSTSCSNLILHRLALSKKTKKGGIEYELNEDKSFIVL
jgi:hypothetical protein